MSYFRLAFPLCALLTLACGSAAGGPDEQSPGHSSSALLGAKPSTIEGKGPVVAVGKTCGGTAIAPNLVLTARHCVSKSEGTSLICDPREPSGEQGTNVNYLEQVPVRYKMLDPDPAAIIIKYFGLPGNDNCTSDIVVCQLDKDLENITFAPLHLDDTIDPLKPGETLDVAGWGVTDEKGTRTDILYEREVQLLAVGPSYWQKYPYPTVPVVDKQILTSGGACAGDSGSPFRRKSTGAVISLVSIIGSFDLRLYADRDLFLPYPQCRPELAATSGPLVHAFKDLIMQAFKEVNREPILDGQTEPPPPPTELGGACQDTSECAADLVCATVGGNSTCTATCNDDPNSCAAGTMCVKVRDQRVCVDAESTGGGTSGTCMLSGSKPGRAGLALWLAALALGMARRRRAG